jgi:hypothetical protein
MLSQYDVKMSRQTAQTNNKNAKGVVNVLLLGCIHGIVHVAVQCSTICTPNC